MSSLAAERVLPVFRPYANADRAACLELFDANSPEYFAPNERDDYERFLDGRASDYVVCLMQERIVGAFGLYAIDQRSAALHWILLSPRAQGQGIGTAIMTRVFSEMRLAGRALLHISASHKSAPFFARLGAKELSMTQDGWGPGMHRVDMLLQLPAPRA